MKLTADIDCPPAAEANPSKKQVTPPKIILATNLERVLS